MTCLSTVQTTCNTADVATDEAIPTAAQVFGENLRRLRERRRLTQHEAARLLLRRGLKWSRGRLAAVEAGNRQSFGLGELVLVCVAFDVPIGALFAGDGRVELVNGDTLSRAGIRDVLATGDTSEVLELHDGEAVREFIGGLGDEERPMPAEADVLLARRLGVPVDTVIRAAVALWGRSLTEERDIRVAGLGDMSTGERQAHRGHITRELAQQVEIRARMTRDQADVDSEGEEGTG